MASNALLSDAGLSPDGDPFAVPESRLRARRNAKWNLYGKDVIPAFVADMDFAVAEPIQAAVMQSARLEDYGYPMREGGRPDRLVADAFVRRMEHAFGWKTDAGLVQVVSDLVQGTFAAILAFSEPGDGVILQVPAYPPFRESINGTGRRLIPLTMVDNGSRFVFDLDEIAGDVADARILLLCNPQNPTGRVFTREELAQLGKLAVERDMIVISDEIHSDLVYPGRHHVPFASLGPEFAERTVTLYSATKSFNIPGLRCACVHFGTAELRERFHKRVPTRLLGSSNSIGMDATLAAWNDGGPWLAAAIQHLNKARDHVVQRLKADAPQVKVHAPEATYLAWLDCSALELTGSAFQFFLDAAKIGFSPGESFDPACGHFVRFNFATSTTILDQILDRFAGAVRKNLR